jgi:hypothetical protein
MSALSICMRVHTGSTSHSDDTHEEHRCAPHSAVRGGVSNFHVIPYTTETKYRPASHQQLPSSIGLSHMENQYVCRARAVPNESYLGLLHGTQLSMQYWLDSHLVEKAREYSISRRLIVMYIIYIVILRCVIIFKCHEKHATLAAVIKYGTK